MCMVDHLTYLLNHWINFFLNYISDLHDTMVEGRDSTHCGGEETGSKCLPSVYPKI